MVITDVSEQGIRETVSMVEQATAAEMMSVSIEAVTVRLGDSDFPVSAGSGGQVGANNSTAGVYAACVKLREAVTQHLVFNSARAEFADGQVRSGNRSVPLGQAAGRDGLMAEELDRVWRPREALPAIDLCRALRGDVRELLYRRDAGAADAGGWEIAQQARAA